MQILRQLWTKDIGDPQVRSTYQYVIDLRERLESTVEIDRSNLSKASRYRNYYNSKAKKRSLKVGDKALILLPTKANKLLMHWRSPFTVTEVCEPLDYKIKVGNKSMLFHINMLKQYIKRIQTEDEFLCK